MLKLFIWWRVEELSEYYPGYAFALAETKEEAIEAVLESPRFYGDGVALRYQLENTHCEIVTKKTGFTIRGSS